MSTVNSVDVQAEVHDVLPADPTTSTSTKVLRNPNLNLVYSLIASENARRQLSIWRQWFKLRLSLLRSHVFNLTAIAVVDYLENCHGQARRRLVATDKPVE